jgi:membrane fusion protein (multidrug efflux system)
MFRTARRRTPLPPRAERLAALAAIALLGLTGGCDKQSAAAPQPQPPAVGVVTLAPQTIDVTTDLPGRVNAFLVAQVRARVDGIVLKRLFVEGSDVKEGQLLYVIDPAPYQASLDAAEAALQKARATFQSAQAQAARYRILVAANAVSKQDYVNAAATSSQSSADIAAAEAQVETAKINLGYTEVRAPISGRIGISQVTVGAYVQASAATLMATIQQLDPVYVDIAQSVADLLKLRREAAEGRIAMAGPDQVKVTLSLDDGSAYPQPGRFQFSDVTVDEGTGSVTLRAIYPNPDVTLLPGMFVHAQLVEGKNEKALLVPAIGVTHDAKGEPTALVVGPDNKVALRVLVTSQLYGANWIVEKGLAPGDRVIIRGVQFVRPGAPVIPVETTP